MATFPNIQPSFPVRKTSKPKTRTVVFGDGYEHRLLFGLNQNPKVYNLVWKNISETDADTIEGFLDSRAKDNNSFTFTPLGEGFTKTGTYSQSGTSVTITITSHGVALGDKLTINYTTGSATNGTFLVASVTDSNVFTVTAASSATNSGNVSITLSGAKQFKCTDWSKNMEFPQRATINATFTQVFEPAT